jgi:iron complex outermembrane receptor protein
MERIEVLRGPASVLYGQAPVGGIINSVSKRPQHERGGEITVEYGRFDFKQVKFDTTGLVTSDGKWSYRLTGLARDADTHVDYVEDDRYAIQPAITYRPDSDTTITVLGHFQKDQTGSTSQFFSHVGTIFPNVNGRHIPYDTFIGEPSDHYDTDVESGTIIAEHKFNSVFKLSHVSRYADIHNDYASSYAGHFYTAAPPSTSFIILVPPTPPPMHTRPA